MGGSVEDLPGGDVLAIEGNSSLRRAFIWGNGSLVGSALFECSAGSSIVDRIACLCASLSDIQSCWIVRCISLIEKRKQLTTSDSQSTSSLWLWSCARTPAATAGSIDPV